jgi:REP element-mobilizing transposase RayT
VRGRGIERRKIFLNDFDRQDFLNRLAIACADGNATIYAWCLMSNHFHLSIRTGSQPLATTMRRLLSGYANSFNSRHNRDGHLFQNRYKSTVIDEERYFLALLRYIHLNPLRARIVEDIKMLAEYPWTGHRVLLGKQKFEVQDTDAVLGRFGATAGAARSALVRFMGEAEERAERKLFKGGGLIRSAGGIDALKEMAGKEKWASDERILGSGAFVEAVLKQAEDTFPMSLLPEKERYEKFAKAMAHVSTHSGFTMAELTGGGRNRELVKVRQVLSYIGVKELGLSAASLGRIFGVSRVSVLNGVETGSAVFAEMSVALKDLL